MWDTPFTRQYDLRYPFVGAGMAMIATPPLVAAVSEIGGLGQLGTGPVSPALLRQMIREVRALTGRPFAVNFIVATTAFGPATTDEHIAVCADEHVAAVVFHWNPPSPHWLWMLHRAGCRAWATVGSLAEAEAAAALDLDAMIVQGREAGGHARAKEGLLTLLPRVRAVMDDDLPLIAAGGIADGRTAAAALAAGAAAVCVGTRLVASEESAAHSEYKARLVAAQPEDTVITDLFGPEWPDAPMRVLVNAPLRRASMPQAGRPSAPPSIGETTVFGRAYTLPAHSSLPPTVHTRGDFDEMCCPAGEGVGFVTKVQPAAEIVREIMAGAARALAAAAWRAGASDGPLAQPQSALG